MSVRDTVYAQVKNVAEQQRKALPALSDELRMLDSGLDSLCLAIIIATLDDELDVSPFDSDTVETPVTFGDLVHIYEHATTTA